MFGTSQPWWRNLRTVGPLVAGLAVAGFALVALIGPRAIAPNITPVSSTNPGSAACVEQYSLDTLRSRSFAFTGTVSAIDGDEVTFKVDDALKGVPGDSVRLTAAGMTGTAITSAGGPNLSMGARYLVAGDATFVWACGFTQPYNDAVVAQWRSAFSS